MTARLHHRTSIRLKGYDYGSAGSYFVTLCTHDRQCLFGNVAGNKMRLNDTGNMVQTVWNELPIHYPGVETDAFVIMPNHVHGIVVITDVVGAGLKPAPTGWIMGRSAADDGPPKRHGLPEIVRGFKTFSARRINEIRGTPGVPVWQRNYYEHIIRDDESLNRIRGYIVNNPPQWELDRENPARWQIADLKARLAAAI